MFEISVGNWVPSCRLMMRHVSEWFGLFYIIYRCMLCFAVVSVIGAVFIAETGRVAASDEKVALLKKQRLQESYSRRLRELFKDLDVDGDGKISFDEFSHFNDDADMRHYMSTFEVESHDTLKLFEILDDGDGHVDIDEFLRGMVAVKGHARSIDIVCILKHMEHLDGKINTLLGFHGSPKQKMMF